MFKKIAYSIKSGILNRFTSEKGGDFSLRKSIVLGVFFLVGSANFADALEAEVFKPQMAPGYVLDDFVREEDGSIWFLERKDPRSASSADQKLPAILAHIDASGNLKEFREGLTAPAAGGGENKLVIAPDKNIWFVELGRIARCTPQGVITEFPVEDTPSKGIFNLAVGADGNLWFTRLRSVGKITMAGHVTEYKVGILQPSDLNAIAAGSDGNMWFTDTANRIGKITPDGVVTEYSKGIVPSAFLGNITQGSDGNMWFVEENLGSIGKITPQGLVTEYFVSHSVSIYGIAVGPDENIWYGDAHRNVIGRVSASGEEDEFPIEAVYFYDSNKVKKDIDLKNFAINKITFFRDGFLWFTDGLGGSFGRVRLPAPIEKEEPRRERRS